MPKRLALPKRFHAAATGPVYARLRALNAEYGAEYAPGNNYPLTVLLERPDDIADGQVLDMAFRDSISEHGAPVPGPKTTKRDDP